MTEYSASERNDPYLSEFRQACDLEKSDPVRYFEALQALAEKGSVNAMVQLGFAYYQGIGTTIDLTESERWYRRAWMEGQSLHAIYWVAYLCWYQAKYEKAYEAATIGAAANEVRCMYWLGRMYLEGVGVGRDRHKARAVYEDASNLGNLFARRDLAWMLMSGGFGLRSRIRGLVLYLRTLKDAFLTCLKNPDCGNQWR